MMIRHSVIFKLKYAAGSAEEKTFLEASSRLVEIPGVMNFEILKQVSSKNKFDYGISMAFNSNEAYQQYNDHPAHRQFIEKYWLNYVEDFLEIDYLPLP